MICNKNSWLKISIFYIAFSLIPYSTLYAAEENTAAASAAELEEDHEAEENDESKAIDEAEEVVAEPSVAAQASAASASSSTQSLFLAAFTRDGDAWFHLLHTKLNLNDISLLHAVCRTTRAWLENPTEQMLKSQRTRVMTLKELTLMHQADCKWAGSFLRQVKINLRPTQADGVAALAGPFQSIIAPLARLPRLFRLGIQLAKEDATQEDWRLLFAPLPQLEHLDLLMNDVAPQAADAPVPPESGAVAHCLLELARLQNLESFSISNTSENPKNLDFSALPTLPKFKQFSITLSRGPGVMANGLPGPQRSFHCNEAQASNLGKCKQLMHLRCGVWSQPIDMQDPVLIKPIIDDGIGQVICGKLDSLLEAQRIGKADEARFDECRRRADDGDQEALKECRKDLPAPNAQPFQLLTLDGTVVSAAVWEYLSQMHSLLSLAPYSWRSDISKERWKRLGNFKNLRTLSLMTHPGDAYAPNPISSEDVLPQIIKCVLLQTVYLQDISLSTEQLDVLARNLSHLKHLSLRTVKIESIAPLVHSKKLAVLSLHFCTQPLMEDGTAQPSFRAQMPSLPSLTSLLVHDRIRITSAKAAPLNAAMRARLPALTKNGFHQNLLADLPSAVPELVVVDAPPPPANDVGP